MAKLPPGDISRRNRAVVAMLDWKIVKLRDLPATHKKALVVHGVWPKQLRAFAENEPERFIQRAMGRGKKFGLASMPMDYMRILVMNDPDRWKDFKTFESYHRYYCKVAGRRVKRHGLRDMWPIILSGRGRDRETIMDGWHRFHAYHHAGAKKVPVMWYADE